MTQLHLSSNTASVDVLAGLGGRISSLVVLGHELLLAKPVEDQMRWGSYPMAPWAGRISHGSFDFGGHTHQMPLNVPPHSAHGTGFISEWTVVNDTTLNLELGEPWPFGGRLEQHFDLDDKQLKLTLAVEAGQQTMPVMLGWHPWFRRFLDGPEHLTKAELIFGPGRMYELDHEAIPTGELVAIPPGPWDNCFTELVANPIIRWPGVVELELASTCDHWVVYTEPENALCVEPQSGPPNQFNQTPRVLAAGDRFEAEFTISWTALDA